MYQNSMRFSGRIAYDFDYEVLAYEMDEGKRLAGALGDRDILIMGQHGLMTVGQRVCDAFDALYYMERAAQIQVGTFTNRGSFGRSWHILPEYEISDFNTKLLAHHNSKMIMSQFETFMSSS